MMRKLFKPLQVLYVMYAFLLFFVFMIPVFLWSLVVSTFGKIRGGNLVYYACMLWADVWFFLIFIRHQNVYIQKPKAHQSYIYVANHISYLDSAILHKTFRKPIRPLGKVEMAKIPLFGTIYKNTVVTVDRSSISNRSRSVQTLKAVLKKEISVLVFPEGTFNTTGKPLKEFYDGAFRIAIETGTSIKPVILLNTFNRMHYRSVFSLNPGLSKAIFLPEVPVNGMTIKDVASLKENVFNQMETALIEYDASWIKN
ncbi:MAG: 1-acyl-sn-glycerol-3-phosphate acyltransferase [Bacteroidota bacterium]|nr:1-acyl-sn-glycerol-3-phosphate acyltransferase [Bacteroidota bacterium]